MFGSNILDVLIGAVFIFLLLSMATSWFTEFWAQVFKLRAKHLKDYLRYWIDDGKMSGYVDQLYNGRVIGALYKKRDKAFLKDRQGPSFISAGDFLTAIFEQAIDLDEGQIQHSFADFKRYITFDTQIPDKLKKPLLAIMSEASAKAGSEADKLVLARAEIEKWYDSIMDRTEGYYKRFVWWVGLFSALLLAVLSNIDTIAISRALWESQELRLSVAATATEFARTTEELGFTLEDGSGDTPGELAYNALQEVGNTLDLMESTNLPLFWKFTDPAEVEDDPYNQNFYLVFGSFGSAVAKIGGILLTATAASFGAQIWFDLLRQLVNMRGAGPKPEGDENEKTDGLPGPSGGSGYTAPFFDRELERMEAFVEALEEEEPQPPSEPAPTDSPDED
jgi:hypothetical protein